MKSSLSTGYDAISSKIVKDQQLILVPILTHMFNAAIETNTYPDPFKVMRIFTKLKPGKDPCDPNSYRDINLVSVFAKIFDRELISQILSFLNENDILPSSHYGGIEGLSTIDALMELQYKIRQFPANSTPSVMGRIRPEELSQ